MQAENNTTGSNRFIKITNLVGKNLNEMEIEIRYRQTPNDKGEIPAMMDLAIALDNEVIPRILESLND